VKAVDEKTSTLTLDDKTKILRGKSTVAAQDINPGERIVVTTMEKKGGIFKSRAGSREPTRTEVTSVAT